MTTPPSPASERTADAAAERLPPGQYVPRGWPVLHYGRVPDVDLASWDLTVWGATADGSSRRWDWAAFGRLPRTEITADLHCVTKFSVLDNAWTGVSTAVLLREVPPAPSVTSVVVWAEYGYSANMRLEDFASPQALLATAHDGDPLTADHGAPVRLVVPHLYAWKGPKWVRSVEYLVEDRRGFWEERGYHNRADPWREQRYSYQEDPGDGPAL
ncbi:MAG: Sulfite oxidase and related enzymes [uncultured Frankineae bacterium]|uniref:Sulfite oxidase and related enzymes n=1 Tax=uncultured Frankineae bacterium TaxID=437475 RepID=A0A6J4LPH7_9ACTN|nr:MAG: Sulfite oxidase and related enzymes [uncultured Frankineae bacterium]